jgi:hypothetical protein
MSTSTLDFLLGRIVDRRDTPEDWEQLDVQADLDPQLWTELLARLRDDARCREAVRVAVRPAATVPLPGRRRRVRPALLAAAAILLGLVLGVQVGRPGGEAAGPDATPATLVGGPASATTAPVVLDELPSLLLATRATGAEGVLEVVYLRRTLECRQVTTLYELQRDDAGVPAPLPVDSARLLTSMPF